MDICFKKILCAMDFSEFTTQMLYYGVGLSKSFSAKLLIFHSVFSPEDQLYATGLAERSGDLKKEAFRAVDRIEQLMAPYDVKWRAIAAKGDPVDQAAQTARREDADLVVAVSRDFSVLKRFFFGTVVERMAKGLDRPFLVVRPPKTAENFEMKKNLSFKNVVVGCDLTDENTPALEYAKYLAGHFSSRLHLLHAVESPVSEGAVDESEGGYDEVQHKLMEKLRNALMELFSNRQEEKAAIIPVIETGIPGEALTRYSKKNRADLLIVGIRRRGAIQSFFVGSTTESVLRHSPCPVLVVTTAAKRKRQ